MSWWAGVTLELGCKLWACVTFLRMPGTSIAQGMGLWANLMLSAGAGAGQCENESLSWSLTCGVGMGWLVARHQYSEV